MFCSHGIFASVSGKQTLVTSFSQRNVCCRICLEQNLFGDSSPNSSASLPTFSIVCLFDSTHPSGRRVVSHCGFHLLSIFFFICLLAILHLHSSSCWSGSVTMGDWFLCSLKVEIHKPSGSQARQFWPLRRVARWNTDTCLNLKLK